MAVVYATLIVKGKKTLNQVPAMLRDQVKEILADLEVPVEAYPPHRAGATRKGPGPPPAPKEDPAP